MLQVLLKDASVCTNGLRALNFVRENAQILARLFAKFENSGTPEPALNFYKLLK